MLALREFMRFDWEGLMNNVTQKVSKKKECVTRVIVVFLALYKLVFSASLNFYDAQRTPMRFVFM